MMNLDQLQRLAEEAADEAEGDWFCPDLLGPGAPPISASTKARRFMQAFGPDTAKKLIAVARAAKYVAYSNGFDAALPEKKEALLAALEELK